MKCYHALSRWFFCSAALLFFAAGIAEAQSSHFKTTITCESGGSVPIVLTFGVNGDGPGGSVTDNTIGYDNAAALPPWSGDVNYKDILAPPAPPAPYDLDARFLTPPGYTSTLPIGLGGGALVDIRGFRSISQVDTFVVRLRGENASAGELAPVKLTWPANLTKMASAWLLKPKSGVTFSDVNMVGLTTYTVTPAAGTTSMDLYIIKTGSLAVSVDETDHALPSSFELHQNFPNPFNPATVIRFELPERVPVVLTVYDVLGRAVRTLANTTLNAGRYQLTFDASGLSSGVYLYRLQAGSTVVNRRMTLLK